MKRSVRPRPPHPARIHLGRLLPAVALLTCVACGAPAPAARTQQPADAASPTPSPSATQAPPVPSCAGLARSLSLRAQIGQLMMVGISSGGVTPSQQRMLARNHVGSVVLLGNSTAGLKRIKNVSRQVHGVGGRPAGVSILLAVDQEGGQVQRLRGPGFDQIPPARSQARLTNHELASRAERWGRQLRAAGVDADLAPVADVVPKGMERVNRPIGLLQRGYGPDPRVVAAKVRAFRQGMDRSGLATAVKHYPGLGRVRGNTDFETNVVDRSTTRHDRALAGFNAGVAAGADMVMMSSASYTKIDRRHRAAFSKVVIAKMLRGDARFTGVVVSDDLAARAVRDYSVGARAVTFLAAGGDLVLVGDPRLAPTMISAVKTKAAGDRDFRARLSAKVTRVLQLKARRGLATCG